MHLLDLAMKYSPRETKKILKRINKFDLKISKLVKIYLNNLKKFRFKTVAYRDYKNTF